MIHPSGMLQHLPFGITVAPIALEIVRIDMHGGGIGLSARVVDRDNPYRVIDLAFADSGPDMVFNPFGSRGPVDSLRSALKRFVCHEVDEAIQVNGVRVFDPHMGLDR